MTKKKLLIGLTVLTLSTPYFYGNYQESMNNFHFIGRKEGKERNSGIMAKMAKKVSVRSGHTLKTPGKVTPNGVPERQLNDKVKVYVINELKNNGFQVLDSSPPLTGPESRTKDAKKINNWGADIHVDLHHNAASAEAKWQTSSEGVEVWYTSNEGKILARNIQNALVQETKAKNRGYFDGSSKRWTMLEATSMPAVIVECGFEDNKKTYDLIMNSPDDAYSKACARGIVMGICDYFGMSYSSTPFGKEVAGSITSDIVGEVKEFQKQNDLVADGIIGPKTWNAISDYISAYIVLMDGLNQLIEENS